jgi:NAD+ diphosphatase
MSFVPGAVPPEKSSPRPRWFLVHPAGLVVRSEAERVALPELSDVVDLGLDPSAALYLGELEGEDYFALNVEEAEVPAPWSVQGLRSLYAALGEEQFVAAGRGVQLATFVRTHRHCGRCGQPTHPAEHEHSVVCAACGLSCYPRIAPAIIVLIRRGELALLGRSARFPTAMYSTLAGFVEPGESLEQTLVREVREEVGVEVTALRYFGSQPWPFPHSLMVGFTAEHAGGEIRVDGEEIVDARWFSVRDLPSIPPRPSIARKLIDAWVADVTGSGSPERV